MQWLYDAYPYILILLGLVLVAVYGFYVPSDYRSSYSLKSYATQAGGYLILGGFFFGAFSIQFNLLLLAWIVVILSGKLVSRASC